MSRLDELAHQLWVEAGMPQGQQAAYYIEAEAMLDDGAERSFRQSGHYDDGGERPFRRARKPSKKRRLNMPRA